MEFFKKLFEKKQEQIQVTFNGINLTNDINIEELIKEIEKNSYITIEDKRLNILLEDLYEINMRVLVLDKKTKCASILDNACFKGFLFSYDIYYIYEIVENDNKELKVLINTGEIAKFHNVNNELKEKLISY